MRDVTLGDTIYVTFTTRSFSTGVPTQLAGTPALSVLESNNATPITSGVSLSVDRASVTGLNEGTVVATGGNGYESGKSYAVYISAGTVGGVSVVGEVLEVFTIQSSAAAVDLANGTDGLGAIKADTAAILADTGTDGVVLASGSITAAVVATGAIDADALAADAVSEIADGVWDEAIAGHLGAGSTGAALNAAGAAGDPWSTALPGAYGAGTAGKIVGDNINAPLATIDTVVDAILADTGTDGVVLSTAMLNKIADHVLRRSIATARAGSDGDTVAFRSLLGAVSKLVNRVGFTGANLLTYEEDDSTTFGTQAATTDAAAEPVTDLNTV